MGETHDHYHENRRSGKISAKDLQSIVDRVAELSSSMAAKMASEVVQQEVSKALNVFREEVREELRNIHMAIRDEAQGIISEAVGTFTLKELIPFSWKITKRIVFLALAGVAGWLGWKYQVPK